MKKKSLFLGMAALLMAGMTSCSDKDIVITEDRVLDHDQSFFVNIAISNTDAMTRANEGTYGDGTEYDGNDDPHFEKGDDVESKINSVYLIFYNSDGYRVATTQVLKNVETNLDNDEYNTGHYIYKGVVQVDVKHGSKEPAYVMCFINPITSSNFEINPDFESLESLQQTTRPKIIDDNNNFAMSKSVYFGIDRNKTAEGTDPSHYKKIIATPLTKNVNLFTTEKAAQDAVDSENAKSVVDIYVERYAAKVNLEIDKHATCKVELDETYTLEFVPEFWAVNAYEENTYICKSFLSSDGTKDLEYLDLIKGFGGTSYDSKVWKWNNPEYHRCYWAQSPAYYAANYPRMADDILDKGKTAYALRYYSYEDMVKNAEGKLNSKARALNEEHSNNKKENNKDINRPIYARENTVSGTALAAAYQDPAASPKAAVASAVIVGHYRLLENNKEVNIGQTGMFFIAGNKVNGYTVYKNITTMKNFFVQTTIPFYKDAQGTTFFDYNNGKFEDDYAGEESYGKFFKITHPTQEAREDLVIDSRYVTIQLDADAVEANKETLPLFVNLGDEYVQVTKDGKTKDGKNIINEVNKQMLYAAGTVQGFSGGKAYYNIPIKHLGFYREDNPNEGLSGREDTFKWTEVQSGDFGLVRNHSYRIVVDNIIGLGNGIPDPKDPIVPPTDPEEYYIGARIIILNWAIVPEQHVTL